MNRIRGRSGFSLIELLTVIAIIAILAAIIFPVMTAVKNKAKETQCINNLHGIQSALKMYKLDNRKYPDHLGPFVEDGMPAGIKFEQVKTQDCLYPEYIRTPQGFKCPNVPTTESAEIMSVPHPTIADVEWAMFVYDSYDAQSVRPGDPGDLHYALVWAPDEASVATFKSAGNDDAQDFARQLRWKNPPEDTVVTWCNYHYQVGNERGMAIVLFLDGHVDKLPGNKINGDASNEPSRWRAVPKT